MTKSTYTRLLAATALTVAGSAAFAECGEFQIAEMNWASAEMMANVDEIILEAGYGCDVELVPGATTTTFASMNEKGQPQVAPELWINAVREPLFAAIDEGRMHSALEGPISGAGEGWFVTPQFLADNPDVNTVEKVIARPDLFPHSEDASKGALVGCPAGWGCQLAMDSLYRAFDMEEKGWLLVDPGSAAGLDGSMAKAAERGESWVGYYWAPTALIGKYDMQLLPFETEWGGSENWDGCIVKPEQECADPKPSSWTKAEIHTVVTDDFSSANAVAMDYFAKRVFPGSAMNSMLVFMQEEQAGGEDAAIEFLNRHPEIWKEWVSEEAAAKIEASL